MTLHRMSTWAILAFWGCSMAWLTVYHLSRPGMQTDAPRPQELLPLQTGKLAPIYWRLSLDQRPIGWAEHQVRRQDDGTGEIRSTVRIERLAIGQLLQNGMGGFGALVLKTFGQDDSPVPAEVNMTIENLLRFDEYSQLQSLTCEVSEDSWGECVQLRGEARHDQLQLKAFLTLAQTSASASNQPIYKTTIRLPEDRSIADAMAPQPQMRGLRVGQRWTMQTYHPLSPASPLQTVEAHVVDREELIYNDATVQAYHVVYDRTEGEPLSWERRLGEAWVLSDGNVVRQSIHWGQFTLTFERQSNAPWDAGRALP